jgi:hypothetical protein
MSHSQGPSSQNIMLLWLLLFSWLLLPVLAAMLLAA